MLSIFLFRPPVKRAHDVRSNRHSRLNNCKGKKAVSGHEPETFIENEELPPMKRILPRLPGPFIFLIGRCFLVLNCFSTVLDIQIFDSLTTLFPHGFVVLFRSVVQYYQGHCHNKGKDAR